MKALSLAVAVLAVVGLTAATPAPAPAPGPRALCSEFGAFAGTVARMRAAGMTQRDVLVAIGAAIKAGVLNPDALDLLVGAVDYVYANESLPPEVLEPAARKLCLRALGINEEQL